MVDLVRIWLPAWFKITPFPTSSSFISFLCLGFFIHLIVLIQSSCEWKWKSLSHARLFLTQARILDWVAFPFSGGSSQPRDQTQVSHTAGRFFTSWATREAQEYWSGWPIPSSVYLPDPGLKPGSPALQVNSLPTELSGKFMWRIVLILPEFIWRLN